MKEGGAREGGEGKGGEAKLSDGSKNNLEINISF